MEFLAGDLRQQGQAMAGRSWKGPVGGVEKRIGRPVLGIGRDVGCPDLMEAFGRIIAGRSGKGVAKVWKRVGYRILDVSITSNNFNDIQFVD